MSEPYTDQPGFHRHRCGACGYVFEHADRTEGATIDYLSGQCFRHQCPACGTHELFSKYEGDAPPEATTRSDP